MNCPRKMVTSDDVCIGVTPVIGQGARLGYDATALSYIVLPAYPPLFSLLRLPPSTTLNYSPSGSPRLLRVSQTHTATSSHASDRHRHRRVQEYPSFLFICIATQPWLTFDPQTSFGMENSIITISLKPRRPRHVRRLCRPHSRTSVLVTGSSSSARQISISNTKSINNGPRRKNLWSRLITGERRS